MYKDKIDKLTKKWQKEDEKVQNLFKEMEDKFNQKCELEL